MHILIGKDKDILEGRKARPALAQSCAAHMLNKGKMLLQQNLLKNMFTYKEKECCFR